MLDQKLDNKPKMCLFHNKEGHTLDDCMTFSSKPMNIRKKFFREHNLCFKCGHSNEHLAKACTERVKCKVCEQTTHPTALHWYGGEPGTEGKAICTNVCGRDKITGKSCAKVVLIRVHSVREPEVKRTIYALIDDQSNKSIAKPEFFDMFADRYNTVPYTLSS